MQPIEAAKAYVYLAIVIDGKGKPLAAPLLGTDRVNAMGRAIARCKDKFGPRSKVVQLTYMGEADLPTIKRTQLLQAFEFCDKVAFAAIELDRLARQSLKMLQDLTTYVERLQAKLAKDK